MIIYRLFAAGDYDKRQKWINDMCLKGYALKKFGLIRYEFEKCKPGEYYYCLELLENLPTNPENQDYINFLRDEWSIEYVDSHYNWVFFRRKRVGGKFNLFSNPETKLSYFKRMLIFRASLIIVLLILSFSNLLFYHPDNSDKFFSILEITIALLALIENLPNFRKYRILKKATYD